jgi:hypothetical protein
MNERTQIIEDAKDEAGSDDLYDIVNILQPINPKDIEFIETYLSMQIKQAKIAEINN